MSRTRSLKDPERRFFAHLADTIFSNPFADQKQNLQRPVTQDAKSYVAVNEALIPDVDRRLHDLEARGISSLEHVADQDRTLLEYAYLFQVYQRHLKDFDTLIERQNQTGGTPVQVPFAKALLSSLRSRGFHGDESLRYIALFYQLRRAYYFIETALAGNCPSMKRLRCSLWNNVFTADIRAYGKTFWNRMEDFSTLLLGETGTGKGSAAAAIGRSGLIPFDPQRNHFQYSFHETFIATNLSQFSENLIESELFGHRKGAFTGAIDHHKGLFERCSPHGSLFLDEIGELSQPVQIKLLNVLQERTFTPVGSHTQLRFEGRVIAATHQDLLKRRAEKSFRDDFFYRLSSDIIEVPPLRQRIEESPDELERLVRLLVTRMTGETASDFEARILQTLTDALPDDYPWPGNVRELEQAIRRIILTGDYVGEAARASGRLLNIAMDQDLTAEALLCRYYTDLYQRLGSYESVARKAGVDRRTVRKYLTLKQSQ